MKTNKIINISICLGLTCSILFPNIVLPVNGIVANNQMLPSDPSFQNNFPQVTTPTEFVGNNEKNSSVILEDLAVRKNSIINDGLDSTVINESQIVIFEDLTNTSKEEIEELYKNGCICQLKFPPLNHLKFPHLNFPVK
jgi:hypothetical protein